MIKAFKTSRYSTRPTGKKQISNNNETILYLEFITKLSVSCV